MVTRLRFALTFLAAVSLLAGAAAHAVEATPDAQGQPKAGRIRAAADAFRRKVSAWKGGTAVSSFLGTTREAAKNTRSAIGSDRFKVVRALSYAAMGGFALYSAPIAGIAVGLAMYTVGGLPSVRSAHSGVRGGIRDGLRGFHANMPLAVEAAAVGVGLMLVITQPGAYALLGVGAAAYGLAQLSGDKNPLANSLVAAANKLFN